MSYGLNFNNQNGFRVIDGGRIIPQFLGKVSLNGPNGYYDVAAQSGYVMRRYRDYTPSQFNNRNTVLFWSMPGVNNDIWYTGGTSVLYNANINAFPHPEVYAFALDYVSQSNANWGCRIWAPNGGPLVYDSGIPSLNIQSIIPNLSVDTRVAQFPESGTVAATRAFGAPRGVPVKPAMTMPVIAGMRQWANRLIGYGSWNASSFMRINNGTIETRFMMTDYEFIESESQISSYDQQYADGQANGYSVSYDSMMIDASVYD